MANEMNGAVVLYTSEDGSIKLDVQIDERTVWLTQQQIAALYGKAKSTISEHLTHIFEDGELDLSEVVRENRTTSQHGAIEGVLTPELEQMLSVCTAEIDTRTTFNLLNISLSDIQEG